MTDASAVHSLRRWAEIRAGMHESMAAGLGLFPLGLAFGLLVMNSGLPWWLAPALSIAVFAGSMELLLVGLLAAVTPLATIALTTFLVNFRHVFYAFSFPLHVVRNPAARAYSVYALIDEAWAITNARPTGWTSWRLVAMQLALQLYWVLGGLVGVVVASMIDAPIEGLGFALCALFITLALDAFRTSSELLPVLLAAAGFTVAALVVPSAALPAGLLLFVAALVTRHLVQRGRSIRA